MFIVSNISNNPLQLSDGKMIASGESRKVEEVDKRDKSYEKRGWLSIVEEEKETPAEASKTEIKLETVGGKAK